MNGRLTTAIQIETDVRVTADVSIEIPVTPPSMKCSGSRNPLMPIAADRIPRTSRNALRHSRETRLTASSYDGRSRLRCLPVDSRAQRCQTGGDLTKFFCGAAKSVSLGPDETAVRRDAFANPVAAPGDFPCELLVQRLGELLTDGRNLAAHLFFGFLTLRRKNEEADRGDHRRHDDTGDVCRSRRRRDRDNRTKPNTASAHGRSRCDRIPGIVCQLARLPAPVEGIDDPLRLAVDRLDEPSTIVVKPSGRSLADNPVLVLASPFSQVLRHVLPLPQVRINQPVDQFSYLPFDLLRRVADDLLLEALLHPAAVQQIHHPADPHRFVEELPAALLHFQQDAIDVRNPEAEVAHEIGLIN